MNTAIRHYCRNPHCRSKLKAPVEDHHLAFCTPSCHHNFYRLRCRICERRLDINPMTSEKRLWPTIELALIAGSILVFWRGSYFLNLGFRVPGIWSQFLGIGPISER